MLFRFSILIYTLSFFLFAPITEATAQESLEKYAYRSPDQRRVFRVDDNKKLNNDEILELMVNDHVAQEKFQKSLKFRKAAWITGGAFVAVASYVLPQEEMREKDFSDYSTSQKIGLISYVGTAVGFGYSLISDFITRSSSISKICLPCKKDDLGHVDERKEYLSLKYYGSGVGLSYNF